MSTVSVSVRSFLCGLDLPSADEQEQTKRDKTGKMQIFPDSRKNLRQIT